MPSSYYFSAPYSSTRHPLCTGRRHLATLSAPTGHSPTRPADYSHHHTREMGGTYLELRRGTASCRPRSPSMYATSLAVHALRALTMFLSLQICIGDSIVWWRARVLYPDNRIIRRICCFLFSNTFSAFFPLKSALFLQTYSPLVMMCISSWDYIHRIFYSRCRQDFGPVPSHRLYGGPVGRRCRRILSRHQHVLHDAHRLQGMVCRVSLAHSHLVLFSSTVDCYPVIGSTGRSCVRISAPEGAQPT